MSEEQSNINYKDFTVCSKCGKVYLKNTPERDRCHSYPAMFVDINTYAKNKEKYGWVIFGALAGLCTGPAFFVFSPLFGYLAYKSKVVKPREEAIIHCREAAHRELRNAVNTQVNEGKRILNEAFSNFDLGNYQEALKDFQTAFELGQDSKELYKAMGICNLVLNNYLEALDWFAKIDSDAEIDQMKARCYINTQNETSQGLELLYKMAISYSEQKIGKDSMAYLLNIYKNSNQKDQKTVEICLLYLKNVGPNPLIQIQLVEALYSQGMYQECSGYCKNFLSENINDETRNKIIQFYSWTLAGLRDLSSEAAQIYLERITNEPVDSKVRMRYGEYLIKQKRLEECILLYKEGLTIFPKDLELKYRLGLVYNMCSMYQEAIGELQTIARVEGFEKIIPKEQLYRSLGRAFLKANLYDLAYKFLSSLEISVDICDMLYELGLAWEASGDLINAKKCFETIYGYDIGYRDVAHKINIKK